MAVTFTCIIRTNHLELDSQVCVLFPGEGRFSFQHSLAACSSLCRVEVLCSFPVRYDMFIVVVLAQFIFQLSY